ncbi:MAG: DEAD/DEAH box helicase [Kofleriaceae bacterium]
MLPFQITASHLRSIAGELYTRGEAYWRDGRVTECAVDDSSIDGSVLGSFSYRVRVASRDGRLVSSCTCPASLGPGESRPIGGAMCKHAVALVLCYLGQRAELPAPEPVVGAFATRDELDAWAAEHHVQHQLIVSAETLCADLTLPPQDYWIKHTLSRLTIRDVGALDTAARHARARNVDVALAKAAYRSVHQAAAVVREALVEEAARARYHDDPAIDLLWKQLLALRATMREKAYPRSRAARAGAKWAFEPTDNAIAWRERLRVARYRDFGTVAVAAKLAFPSGKPVELECVCGAPRAACSHGIAMIDATLDRLEDPDPRRVPDAVTLARQLLKPPWARALDAIDQIEEQIAKPRAAIEVWWEIVDFGPPQLRPVVKKRLKNGTFSSGERIPIDSFYDLHREHLNDFDRYLADHLSHRTIVTFPVAAFTMLVGHPRVLFEGHDEPVAIVRAQLGFNVLAAGDQIQLEPSVEGARFEPRILTALFEMFEPGEPVFYQDLDRNRCLLIDVSDDARKLWVALSTHGETFPPEAHTQLLERLGRMEARLPLSVPQALKGDQIEAEASTVVRLRLLPDLCLELELFVRPGPGAPLFPPGTGPRDVLLVRDGKRGYVRRELDEELGHARTLIAQLPMASAEEGPPQCFRIGDPDEALALVAALQDPPPGISAEWLDEKKPTVRGKVGVDNLRVKVERKQEWFGIDGEVKYEDGRIELALLLDAARRQQKYVRIDQHRWVELTDKLRERLLAVADQTYAGKDRLELSPGAVPAIKALADAGAKVDQAASWADLTKRLASSRSLRPKPPATLQAKLRDYQIEGHAWMSRVAAWGAGACLADDMGLGKTMQAIAVLLDRAKHGPAFVLAPTSVTFNWIDELRRFAPSLRPVLYNEQADRAGALAGLQKRDVLIASYGLLVNDIDQLAATKFATLVIDEAQALKNPTTQRAKAARRLVADFRLALSGTPFENHLGELWSLFAIVFPGLLGSWEQFRDRFAVPIEKYGDPQARAALARVLRPFLLRRTKQEVARELPARTEIQVPVALSEEEQALYEDARLAALAELATKGKGLRDQQRRFQVLAALTRLRLLASHPRLYDPSSTLVSSKLRRAIELLEELREEGHRALVFSQFTSHLALVREALDAAGFRYLYLDGSTPAGERARLVRRFQAGEGELFLISLKAGGQGINLTGADYILHLDPWWNPAVEDQATDRAHRIGQTKPVTVYRLISRATIEERIVALHADKRALVAGILEGSDVAARLTTKDLLTLLQTR